MFWCKQEYNMARLSKHDDMKPKTARIWCTIKTNISPWGGGGGVFFRREGEIILGIFSKPRLSCLCLIHSVHSKLLCKITCVCDILLNIITMLAQLRLELFQINCKNKSQKKTSSVLMGFFCLYYSHSQQSCLKTGNFLPLTS